MSADVESNFAKCTEVVCKLEIDAKNRGHCKKKSVENCLKIQLLVFHHDYNVLKRV